MPRRQLTRGTWAESHGQRYILNIPGLFRIWRPEPDHSSRRDPAGDSPHTQRWPLRPYVTPQTLDSTALHHWTAGNIFTTVSHPMGRLSLSSRFRRSTVQQHPVPNEVRQPALARQEGELRRYYFGTSSRSANMHSRRRRFEANDNYRHQSRIAAVQPPRRSEYPYSHTAYPHSASEVLDSNQDPYTSGRSRYEGSQIRLFDNNDVPPFAPEPLSARYGDASSFRSSSGRGRVCFVWRISRTGW